MMRSHIVNRMIVCGLFVLCIGVSSTISQTALAEDGRRHEFHGRDVRHFDHHERDYWRGGLWRQEWHNGRLGWWWVVGGVWYFYERPIYPYPQVVSEYAYPETVIVTPPPPAAVAPAPPAVIQQAAPPPGQPPMWYYCDNPAGYYPYVPTCPTPFRPVPAQPH